MTTKYPNLKPTANTGDFPAKPPEALPKTLPDKPKAEEDVTKLAAPEKPPKLEEMYYHFALARS